MTCLSNGDSDDARLHRQELPASLETSLENYLRSHLVSKDQPGNSLLRTIGLLQGFASSVRTDQFKTELGRLLSPIPATASELVKCLADVFCNSAEGIETDLLKKSLQEALLLSTDVQGDATVVQFRDLLHKYLGDHETLGLTRLFVGLHMFNTVWLELLESDAVSPDSEQTLDRLTTELEKACFAKVDAAIASGLITNMSKRAVK